VNFLLCEEVVIILKGIRLEKMFALKKTILTTTTKEGKKDKVGMKIGNR
jgi:hypothetical protein